MKRLLIGVTCLVLSGLLGLGALPLSARGAADPLRQTDIEVSVRFDYDDQVRTGTAVPAFVKIDNRGATIDGVLRVSVTPYKSDMASTYELPVYVDQGVKAEYTVPFRAMDSSDSIHVHLLQGDRVVAQAEKSGSSVRFTDNSLVGIFSGGRSGMAYWHSYSNTLRILDRDHNNIKVTPMELEAGDLPEEFYLLDRFALLVFNHYDLGYFNEAQINALAGWVRRGGHLLVDADAANSPAVRSLAPIIDLEVAGVQSPQTNEASPQGRGVYREATALLEGLGRVEPAGAIVMGSAERPLVMKYPVGRGEVFVTTFALDDIALEELGIADIVESIPGLSARSESSMEQFPSGRVSSADSYMRGAVKSIAWLDAPHILWVVSILAVFILLAGPVSYFVLKKWDKRDWMWVSAPALSLCFCIVITGYGVLRHGSQPLSSVVTVVDQRGDRAPSAAYSMVGIAAPRQGRYNLTFDEETFPYKMVERNYYYSDLPSDQEPPAGRPVARFDFDGYPGVTFSQIRQWNMDTVCLQRDLTLPGALQATVRYKGNSAYYTIKNETGTSLEEVTVATYEGYARIPYLEAGEEAQGRIEKDSPSYIVRELYGYFDGSRSEEENREIHLKSQMENLLIDYLSGNRYDEPLVWAWSRELGALAVTANGRPVKTELNRTMLIGEVKIAYDDGGELYIPPWQRYGTIVDAQGSYALSYLGETYVDFDYGEATFAFYLPDMVKEYGLTEFVISAETHSENVAPLLYNNLTDDWDEYLLDTVLQGESAQEYIRFDGSVLMKVVREAPDEDGEDPADTAGDTVYIYNPSIGVLGKEKANAGN